MKRSLLLLVPALLAAFFFSCKKDEGGHNTVTPGAYRSLEDAIASTAPLTKSTSMSVSAGATLFAPGGTKFIIPPNVFETLTGGKVTGSVQVTIQDWLKKGDMIFGRVLPIMYFMNMPPQTGEISYEKPLISAGEAFIQVTQNGQVLRIKKDTFISVLFPQFGASTPTGLTGWVGRTMIGSANTVNWLSVDSPVRYVTYLADTVAVQCDTLHYIQAAMPLDFTGTYNNFTVRLSAPVTMEKSMAVALYANNKSIFPLPTAIGGEIKAVGIPSASSLPMHVAVMGINQGNFYGGIVDITAPANDSIYHVIMKPMEPPTLKLMLNAL